MGQSAGAPTCAGRDWNEKFTDLQADVGAGFATAFYEKPYHKDDLLQSTLNAMPDRRVLDRASLTQRYPFDDFVKLDQPVVNLKLAITNDGRVYETDDRAREFEAMRHKHLMMEFSLPGFADVDMDTFVHPRGGGKVFTVFVNSDECPVLEPIIRRCESEDEIVQVLLTVLSAGADSVNLTLCHQMLELEFDKVDVLQEQEAMSQASAKIITSYLWVRMLHFKFLPKADELQKFFAEVKTAKTNRDHIVQGMRRDGRLSAEEVDRFIEGTGGKRRLGPKTARYLRMMVKKSKDRPFHVQRCDSNFQLPQFSARSSQTEAQAERDDDHTTIARCVTKLVDEIKADSVHSKDWTLLVGWEPMQVTTVAQSLHEAQRSKVTQDEPGYIRNALKAVEISSKKAQKKANNNDGQQKDAKEALTTNDVDGILSASKTMLDSMIESMLAGEMSRERFEEHFEKAANSIMDFLENNLLPIARKNGDKERVVLCQRTLADYQRYLYVWIPSKRDKVHDIEMLYKESAQMAANPKDMHPYSLVGLVGITNYAVFQGEVHRRYDLAARVCREGIAARRRHLPMDLGTSQIFNWHLIGSNLLAFETFLVVLQVAFRHEDLAAHEAVEIRPTDDRASEPQAPPEEREEEVSVASNLARSAAPAMPFACLGARDRLCLDRARAAEALPTSSAAPASSRPHGHRASPAAAENGKLRAVHRWLRSRPLYRWTEKDEESDDDGDDSEEVVHHNNVLLQVRWVDQTEQLVCKVEKEEAESSSSSEDETDPVAVGKPKEVEGVSVAGIIKKFHSKLRLSMTTGAPKGGEIDTFCLSAAVRVQHAVNGEWQQNFLAEMQALTGSSEVQRRQVQVNMLDEVGDILDSIDHGSGVLMKKCRTGDQMLGIGDTLLMEGAFQGLSIGEAMLMLVELKLGGGKDRRQGLRQAQLPLSLKFLRAMEVAPEGIQMLTSVPYAEVHPHFTGFRDMGILSVKNSSTSPVSMADMFHKSGESAMKSTKGGKAQPRRLRNLSARRNPTKAGTTGCQ